jgi:hypothetical protein
MQADLSQPMVWQMIIGLGLLLLSTLVGVIGWMLREKLTTFEIEHRRGMEAMDSLTRQLASLQAILPKEYVLRDDYIRQIARFDSKLDLVASQFDGRRNAS